MNDGTKNAEKFVVGVILTSVAAISSYVVPVLNTLPQIPEIILLSGLFTALANYAKHRPKIKKATTLPLKN